jgi:hypothetical protein
MTDRDAGSGPVRGRRDFFRSLLRDTIVLAQEAQGRPQLRLSDLGRLPEARLREVVPEVVFGAEVSVEGSAALVLPPGSTDEAARVPIGPAEALRAAELFDGEVSLGQVADALAEELGMEPQAAFSLVRSAFLAMVDARACVPANDVY